MSTPPIQGQLAFDQRQRLDTLKRQFESDCHEVEKMIYSQFVARLMTMSDEEAIGILGISDPAGVMRQRMRTFKEYSVSYAWMRLSEEDQQFLKKHGVFDPKEFFKENEEAQEDSDSVGS